MDRKFLWGCILFISGAFWVGVILLIKIFFPAFTQGIGLHIAAVVGTTVFLGGLCLFMSNSNID